MHKELIKEITKWLKEYDATRVPNLHDDYDTFEGGAYMLLSQAKRALQEKK